jgi:hypothetical protein
MARFLKHVGKHGDRKVAIIFRQLPGDEHMCLVVYTELLNQNIHDPLMVCIESPEGQASENLAEALNRTYTKDGQIILQFLHRESLLKRVQTELIMMTPAPNQKIKLSELNKILNEMEKGEEAIRRLAEIDASRGLQDPKDVAKRMRGESTVNPITTKTTNEPLANNDLATNLRTQAMRMSNEAKGLMAEAERLLQEASQMETPVTESTPVKKSRTKKTAESKITSTITSVVQPKIEVVETKKKITRAKKAVVS